MSSLKYSTNNVL